jgi:hypothetical protein
MLQHAAYRLRWRLEKLVATGSAVLQSVTQPKASSQTRRRCLADLARGRAQSKLAPAVGGRRRTHGRLADKARVSLWARGAAKCKRAEATP